MLLLQCAPLEAGVLVPLFEDDEGVVNTILTERSATLKHHAGEVALPGGKRDPRDVSIQDTALREAHEEVSCT
jgi:8-oxo-dGTP pyrophosphatase MutT (NUDIX family)